VGLLRWWRTGRRSSAKDVVRRDTHDSRRRPGPAPDREDFSLLQGPWSPGGIWGGTHAVALAARISREEALEVPAVIRGRNLICGTVSSLPLRTIDAQNRPVASRLLQQIDPTAGNCVTLSQTLEDLIFEASALWKITEFGWDGYPVAAEHVATERWSTNPPEGVMRQLPSGVFPGGSIWIDGVEVGSAEVIRFDSPLPPLLVHGARAIRRARRIEKTAETYAEDPRALGYFQPDEDTPFDGDDDQDAEVRKILDAWAEARRTRATGYVPGWLKYQEAGSLSPAELQLGQLQQRAALDVVNLMGLDAEDFGINVTSRTYQNAVERRLDKINEVYGPYMRAITDRLSLGDVTKRGQVVHFVLDDFLKADPKARAEINRTYIDARVLDVDEVRAREGYPRRTTPIAAAPSAAPQDAPRDGAGAVQQEAATMSRHLGVVSFSGDDTARQTITFSAADFRASAATRTVSGTLVPYGPVGVNRRGKWRFAPGSIYWTKSAVSRVKLNREHDRVGSLLGSARVVRGSDSGVDAEFKVGRHPAGDEALHLAEDEILDGLSAEVEVEEWRPDPVEDDVILVTRALLTGAALTATPGFTDARLTHVAASQHAGGRDMHCTMCGHDHAPGTPCVQTGGGNVQMSGGQGGQQGVQGGGQGGQQGVQGGGQGGQQGVQGGGQGGQQGGGNVQMSGGQGGLQGGQQGGQGSTEERFTRAVEAFTAAVEALGQVPQEQRQIVPAGRARVREPLVYSLDGRGNSYVRDAWEVKRGAYGSPATAEAFARLKKYEEQTQDLARVSFNARLDAQMFANAGNTTDQAQIIPPGYRPDLYVGQIPQGRPLFEAMSRGSIANATPFKVPVWVGSSGLSGTNSEGTGPSTGTITDHTYRTVTPTAQSGEFIITRELVDSANPAIDQIALAAMREEYSQDTEGVISTALAAATDDGTPTQGTASATSTEGCYVYVVTGTGNDLAAEGIRFVEAEFPFHRFTVAPDRCLLSSQGWGGLIRSVDDVGRPLFPFTGAQNGYGTVGQAAQTMNVDGLPGMPAWALDTDYDDVVMFNHVDAWAWESPLLSFRFEEKQGPENICLNIWGYFAFQILRYPGIHVIRYAAA